MPESCILIQVLSLNESAFLAERLKSVMKPVLDGADVEEKTYATHHRNKVAFYFSLLVITPKKTIL